MREGEQEGEKYLLGHSNVSRERNRQKRDKHSHNGSSPLHFNHYKRRGESRQERKRGVATRRQRNEQK